MPETLPRAKPKFLLFKEYLQQLRQLFLRLMREELSQKEAKKLFGELYLHYQTKSLRRDHQLIEALLTACSLLISDDCLNYAPETLSGGAAPFSIEGIYLEDEVPLIPQQLELATLWAFIGKLSGEGIWIEAALKTALWHANLVDHDFTPFIGLFTREGEADLPHILGWNRLLFLTVGELAGRPELIFLGKRIDKEEAALDDYGDSLENWRFSIGERVQEGAGPLSSQFVDATTATSIVRSDNISFASTLYGSGSGLGALSFGSLKIAAFGPQNLPFGDCSCFGIQNSPSLQKRYPNFEIEECGGGLRSCGRVRIAYGSKYWMEIEKRFNESGLQIEATVYGIEPIDRIAFALFANAEACSVEGGGKTLLPKSLDNERGEARPLSLAGGKRSLTITPLKGCRTMEIFPLAGGGSFWGADFLIGFPFIPGTHKYGWQIVPD